MKSLKYINLLIIILLFSSCDNCTKPISDNALFNVWVKYDNDSNTFRSADKLEDNLYGFIIEQNGTFIERKNAGWCGTPPIYRENFDGTWKELSENLLEIIVDYWGGVDTFKIEILSVDESELKINYIYNYE